MGWSAGLSRGQQEAATYSGLPKLGVVAGRGSAVTSARDNTPELKLRIELRDLHTSTHGDRKSQGKPSVAVFPLSDYVAGIMTAVQSRRVAI